MCLPFLPAYLAPCIIAQLSPSLPQEVKYTSSLVQPRALATYALASSRSFFALLPIRWVELGLAYSSVIALMAADAASGQTRVVAALSRYIDMAFNSV